MARTCPSCNDILSNPSSRESVLYAKFEYRRAYHDLQLTAAEGCVLCGLLIARHDRYGDPEIQAANGDILVFNFTRPNRLSRNLRLITVAEEPFQSLIVSGISKKTEDEIEQYGHDRLLDWHLRLSLFAEAGWLP
jgi:hypothetical protein